jgi:hypothetical protein
MRRIVYAVLIAGLLLAFPGRGQSTQELRIDSWSANDLSRKNAAARAVIDAEADEQKVIQAIEMEHGIVAPDREHPCAPYDQITSNTGTQFVVRHITPLPDAEGSCDEHGSDEGIYLRSTHSYISGQ